jgi:hypothetical protein
MTRFEELELLRQSCRNLTVLLETVLIVCKPIISTDFYDRAREAVNTSKLLA